MSYGKTSLGLAFGVSAAVHGVLIFLLVVHLKNPAVFSSAEKTAKPFSLIDVSVIEAEAPPAIQIERPYAAPYIEPAAAEIPAQSDALAETFIAVDEITERPDTREAVVGQAAAHERWAAGGLSAGGVSAETSALTAAYVKRNYNYIQQRIGDRVKYPAAARRAGVQGTAEIIFTIHDDGTISMPAVRTSSGAELLDQAALDAVNAAAPFPRPPAAARIAIPVSFKLK
jgi:protein TonB